MKQFLKQTLASLIGSLAGLFLFFAIGAGGLVFLLINASLKEETPVVEDKSVLVLDLATQINDTKPTTSLQEALTEKQSAILPLRQVLAAIERATTDPNIVGIFLDGRSGDGQNGYATLKEVRNALEKFRSKGKKIFAYNLNWTEKGYYLASIADEVVINPLGAMEINGLSTQQTFLKGALDKYGIGMQIVRVGNYKSAVEPYIRSNYSPENRQQLQALLGDIWGEFTSTVAKSRKIEKQEVQSIADNLGVIDANTAKVEKLVDRIAYFDEVETELKQITDVTTNEESFRQVDLKTYIDGVVEAEDTATSEQKIAILYAEGEIVSGEGSSDTIGGDRFAKELRSIRDDEAIKAVIIRINSPGGSATASDIILRELLLIQKEKPVIVSMGNVAASGGYWIATGADYIFAENNTITGSIGVFGQLPNIQKLANNNGITWDSVKTGKLADIDSVSRPKTEAELAIYQKSVNQIYDLFLTKVANSRKLTKTKVAQIAQGKVWSGEAAKKIGLVDEIGGLERAIAYAAKKAKLGIDWTIEEYPSKRSFDAEFLGRFLSTQSGLDGVQIDPLTAEYLQFQADLKVLQSNSDPRNIYARLPFNLNLQ
jgi:protease IV